jgi:hypothetical protein
MSRSAQVAPTTSLPAPRLLPSHPPCRHPRGYRLPICERPPGGGGEPRPDRSVDRRAKTIHSLCTTTAASVPPPAAPPKRQESAEPSDRTDPSGQPFEKRREDFDSLRANLSPTSARLHDPAVDERYDRTWFPAFHVVKTFPLTITTHLLR